MVFPSGQHNLFADSDISSNSRALFFLSAALMQRLLKFGIIGKSLLNGFLIKKKLYLLH